MLMSRAWCVCVRVECDAGTRKTTSQRSNRDVLYSWNQVCMTVRQFSPGAVITLLLTPRAPDSAIASSLQPGDLRTQVLGSET